MCSACDQTCLTCQGPNNSECLTCNAADFRQTYAAPPTNCGCMLSYVPDPSGGAACMLCSFFLTGCNTCSSTSTCTACINGFSGPTMGVCACIAGIAVNGYCTTILGCTMMSIVNSTQTCTTCDSAALMELSATFTCTCIFGATTLSSGLCQATCGDNYVLPV